MGGVNTNYEVVKYASKRYKLDHLEVLRVCKVMNGEYQKDK